MGHCCGCSASGSIWGFIEGASICFLGAASFFTIIRVVNPSPGDWPDVPPPESEDSLADHEKEWETFFLEVIRRSGMTLGGLHHQFAALGMANLMQFALLLRDLRWHEGVGVLTKTLTFAAQDLQDVVIVTAILIGGFSSMGFGMFGAFGAQDSFSSWGSSFFLDFSFSEVFVPPSFGSLVFTGGVLGSLPTMVVAAVGALTQR